MSEKQSCVPLVAQYQNRRVSIPRTIFVVWCIAGGFCFADRIELQYKSSGGRPPQVESFDGTALYVDASTVVFKVAGDQGRTFFARDNVRKLIITDSERYGVLLPFFQGKNDSTIISLDSKADNKSVQSSVSSMKVPPPLPRSSSYRGTPAYDKEFEASYRSAYAEGYSQAVRDHPGEVAGCLLGGLLNLIGVLIALAWN